MHRILCLRVVNKLISAKRLNGLIHEPETGGRGLGPFVQVAGHPSTDSSAEKVAAPDVPVRPRSGTSWPCSVVATVAVGSPADRNV